MSDILFHYERVYPTSWAYLSSLLTIALFFKFNRLLSVRNVDLFLLISIAPGPLMIWYGIEFAGQKENALVAQRLGYLWMFAVNALLMLRLLLDSAMVRRPLLEPNLNSSGLAFLASSLLFFLMANVVTGRVSPASWKPSMTRAEIRAEQANNEVDLFDTEGPGYWLMYLLPRITTQTVMADAQPNADETPIEAAQQQQKVRETTSRVVAILSHVLIVVGLVVIGARHFDNTTAGIASAAMYLMLPYTALFTGDVQHALPAALLVWAIVLYRRPLAAGLLIGLASGTIYYPIFLVPLWSSYYWERGVKRFLLGVAIAVGVLVATLALTAVDFDRFLDHVSQMFGFRLPLQENLQGIWGDQPGFWNPAYRLPILFGFGALALSFVAWPASKNLGTLISCTGALMVGTQFWHAHGGGRFVAWYLPLLLAAIFRPNLQDRIALAMVPEGWWQARQKARETPLAA